MSDNVSRYVTVFAATTAACGASAIVGGMNPLAAWLMAFIFGAVFTLACWYKGNR